MPIVRLPNGRGYGTSRPRSLSLQAPPTPLDPRSELPDSRRRFTDTTLPDGTVLRTWEDPPLGGDEAPAGPPKEPPKLPDELHERPLRWLEFKPLGKREGPDRWVGPAGPMPRRR
jgi:hypothetical protein